MSIYDDLSKQLTDIYMLEDSIKKCQVDVSYHSLALRKAVTERASHETFFNCLSRKHKAEKQLAALDTKLIKLQRRFQTACRSALRAPPRTPVRVTKRDEKVARVGFLKALEQRKCRRRSRSSCRPPKRSLRIRNRSRKRSNTVPNEEFLRSVEDSKYTEYQ